MAEEQLTLNEFCKFLRPLNQVKEDDIIEMYACDVVGVAPLEYFNTNRMLAKIRIDVSKGSVSIWKSSSQSYPDKRYTNLILDEK